MKKKIIWRFDDLCFDKNSEFYVPLSRIKKIANCFYENKQKANFSLIITEDIFSKEAMNLLESLKKQGHQILAHGAPHCNWQKLNKNQIEDAVKNMRKILNKAGINIDIFVFPGLKAKHCAYKYLKKNSFNVVIKGHRCKGLSRIIDVFCSYLFKIDFLYQNYKTNKLEWSLKSANSIYGEIIKKKKKINHVMDHLWLYDEESIKRIDDFLKKTSTEFDFITLEEFRKNFSFQK